LERLMRMTSSPAAGLLVVPLVTVPERVWAEAETAYSAMIPASVKNFASLVKRTPWCPCALTRHGSAKKSAHRRPCDRQSRTINIHQPVFGARARWFNVTRADHISWPWRSPTLLNCNEGCCEFALSNENCLSARLRISCERARYCRQKSVVARCCIGC
jgi:hypothetical protein